MKITKLPNNCDPVLIIQNRSREKYSVCPMCGESRNSAKCLLEKIATGKEYQDFLWGGVERRNLVPSKGWYGPAEGDILGIFLPWRWHHWHIDSYKCHTCGAEWDSDPYPVDIKGV